MGCYQSIVPSITGRGYDDMSYDPEATDPSRSRYKWRTKPTIAKAREKYEKDGTIPANCSSNILELRMHLAESILLKSFGEYARDVQQLTVLMCWADILEFKGIREEQTEYQISKAFHIYHKYIKEDAVVQLSSIGFGIELREDIKSVLETATANGGGVSAHIFDKFHLVALELLYQDVFCKYRGSSDYRESLAHLGRAYNQVSIDDFEYMEELGSGGFGCVVRCKKKSTGIEYAMKIQTKNGLLKNFFHDPRRVAYEKEALALCHHPFIVSMDYAFQTSNLVLMVMDLGTAGTLLDSLAACENRRMPEDRVRFYSAEIVLTLAHIHRMGMIYRDLKPANVLLCADGHIKLVDLGGVIDVGGQALGYCGSPAGSNIRSPVFQAVAPDVAEISIALKGENAKFKISSAKNDVTLSQENKKSMTMSFNSDVDKPQNCSDSASAAEKSLSFPSLPSAKDSSSKVYRTAEPPSMRKANSVMGTGGFMAPEMLAMVFMVFGDTDVNKKGYTAMVDFWSLAVTMHKLLTGLMPFHNTHLSSFVDYLRKTEDQRVLTMPSYLDEFNCFIVSLLDAANVSPLAENIIFKFLNIDYRRRLGYGVDGVKNIQNHDYFKSIEWNKLAQKHIVPPFIPGILDAGVTDDDSQDCGEGEAHFASFGDMLAHYVKDDWDLCCPPSGYEEYFSNWDFVSPSKLKVELGIEQEMHSLDAGFKTLPAEPLLDTLLSIVSQRTTSSLFDAPLTPSGKDNSRNVLAEIGRQCTGEPLL